METIFFPNEVDHY